jgi:FeS assembly protein IscX
MAGITWDQIDNIALSLLEKHPEMDPLTVRFTDLHKWVTELPGFDDDPAASSEGKLEAIQMAWYDEWQDAQE